MSWFRRVFRAAPKPPKDAAGVSYADLACCCGEPLNEWRKRNLDDFLSCRHCGKVSPFRMHYHFQRAKAMGHFSADAYRWELQQNKS